LLSGLKYFAGIRLKDGGVICKITKEIEHINQSKNGAKREFK